MAQLRQLLSSAQPRVDALIALDRDKRDNGARLPEGSAYSHRWAYGEMPGKVRMARRLGRTRRCCPVCLEQDRVTETSDRWPYCAEHVLPAHKGALRQAVLVALGVDSGQMAEWARLDLERREAAKAVRRPRMSDDEKLALARANFAALRRGAQK